jgi:hypothetical protein
MKTTRPQTHKSLAPENRRKTGVLKGGVSPDVGKATRFRPGESGNPGGRSKRKLQSEAFRAELEKVVREGDDERTKAEVIAAKMVEQAMAGDVRSSEHVAEYVEGIQRIDSLTLRFSRRSVYRSMGDVSPLPSEASAIAREAQISPRRAARTSSFAIRIARSFTLSCLERLTCRFCFRAITSQKLKRR